MSQPYRIRVLSKTVWSQTLFSFRTERPEGFRFEAGQFARIGLIPSKPKQPQTDAKPIATDEPIFRAYSIVSSPYDEHLEFFSVVVAQGAFTSQLQYLSVGDELLLEPSVYGFLTLSRYQQQADTLWLLATGTGLAPFLSILSSLEPWQAYQKIILAYSVRHEHELAYEDSIHALPKTFGVLSDTHTDFVFLPIVTRTQPPMPRLPNLIATGELERQAGSNFDQNCHVMLCGNPQMIDDTKAALINKGLAMNRRGVGQIAVENYW